MRFIVSHLLDANNAQRRLLSLFRPLTAQVLGETELLHRTPVGGSDPHPGLSDSPRAGQDVPLRPVNQRTTRAPILRRAFSETASPLA